MDDQPESSVSDKPSPVMQPARGTSPSWLPPVIVIMLAAQLGLLWIQGGLLHRQHQEIRDLREDIQSLSENLDANASPDLGNDDTGVVPGCVRRHRHAMPLRPVRFIQDGSRVPTEEDKARKELEAAKVSAEKAVSDARDIRSKLSIEENIRKADAKAERERAERTGMTWVKWISSAVTVLALILFVRAWMRRRS